MREAETILASETGLGKYQVEVRVGDAVLLVDEPLSAGGLGSGPNPYDLLSAALGACTSMTVRLYADRKGWPLQHVQTAVRHSRAGLNARDRYELDIALDGALDDTQRARLMEIAERCPVHLSLVRGADVTASLLERNIAPPPPSEGPAHMECMVEACAD